MHCIDVHGTRAAALALLILASLLSAGCGDSTGAGTATDQPTAMPASLAASLASVNISVSDREFAEEETSDFYLSAFAKQYDPELYDSEPEVFPVVVDRSSDALLEAGASLTIVHYSGVPQDVWGQSERTARHPRPSPC